MSKKNKIFGFLIIGLLCLFLYGCSCSEHTEHNYKLVSTYNCVNGGEVTLKCSCGESLTDERLPQEHEFDLSNKCSNCGLSMFGSSGLVFDYVGDEYMVVDYNGSEKCVVIPFYNEGRIITGISAGAFQNKGLEELIFSSNILTIQQNAFYENPELQVVRFEGLEETYSTINFGNSYSNPLFYSARFFIGQKEIDRIDALNNQVLYPNMLSGVSFDTLVLPNTIKVVMNGAFNGCTFNNISYLGSFTEWNEIVFEGLTANPLNFMSDNGEFCLQGKAFSESMLSTITTLNDYALSGYKGESLSFSEGLEKLAPYSLSNCKNLKDLSLPNSLSTICEGVFYGSKPDEIALTSGVVDIEERAFCGTASFINFDEASNIIKLSENMFDGYLGEKIVVPSQVENISAYAFSGATELKELVINGNIESFRVSSFVVKTSIKLDKLYLPASLRSLDSMAFDGSIKVDSLYFSGDLEAFILIDNVGVLAENTNFNSLYVLSHAEEFDSSLKNTQRTNIETLSYLKVEGDIVIPSVSYIQDGTFMNLVDLTGVTFVSSVQLGEKAFMNCGIKSIDGFDYITSIGSLAFANCDIRSLEINSSLSIWGQAFLNNENLTSIAINAFYSSGSNDIFENCNITHAQSSCSYINLIPQDNLREVIISADDSNTSVRDDLSGCESLEKLELVGITTVGINAFIGCVNLRTINLGGVMYIGNNAFLNCYNLYSVVLGESLQPNGIGSNAFLNCYKLVEIVNNSSLDIVTSNLGNICDYALNIYKEGEGESKILIDNGSGLVFFDNNGSLLLVGSRTNLDGEITLQDKYFGSSYEMLDYAFYGSNISSIELNGGGKLSEHAFQNCKNLNLVSILSGVGSIEYQAFYGLENLSTVVLQGVENIKAQAFYGCTNLSELVLSKDITNIENQAFTNCFSLVQVKFMGSQSEFLQINILDDYILDCEIYYNYQIED